MDFMVGLPKVGNKFVIMVIVDYLSKYAHFYAFPHPFTLALVVHIFMDRFLKLHGMPSSIILDCGPTFTRKFWWELFMHQGTQLNMSTSYHSQSIGKMEVINKCLETYLHYFSSEKKHQ